LKQDPKPLAEVINRLLSSFSKLRRRKIWTSSQVGGASFLEIKRAKTSSSWNAHLHVIAEGTYLPYQALSNLWHQITGDSYVVDIRIIKSESKAANYVTKYASKGLDGNYLKNPDLLQEAILALSGRRLCTNFGSWRGKQLLKSDSDLTWIPLGKLSDFLDAFRRGSEYAIEVINHLWRKQTWETTTEKNPTPGPSP